MVREHNLLCAVHPLYPLAPRPILLCEDPAVIGATFFLMERRRGLILRDAVDDPALIKNQGSLVNVIYRPRSDLLFSAEYRHLKTFTIDNSPYNADHVNLMMGVLF